MREVIVIAFVLPLAGEVGILHSGERASFLEEYLEVVDVGSRKQVLFDDYVILEKVGIKRVVGHPEKVSGNPIIRPEGPEENGLINPSVVIYDPRLKRFRMWYHGGRTDETMFIGYAESGDGIHWQRCASTPDGKAPVGSKPFNKVWIRDPKKPKELGVRCLDPGVIVYHPWEQDGAKRYKMILRRGMPVAFSPDGYVWTSRPGMVPRYRGTKAENTFVYDPLGKRWLAYLRQNPPKRDGTYLRRILIDQSEDMVTWKPTGVELSPDRGDGFGTSFFRWTAFAYNGVFIGFPGLYITAEHHDRALRDRIQTELAFSRDGLRWDRPFRGPLIPRGPAGSWDSSMLEVNAMVARDDKIYFYYLGTAKKHRDPDSGMMYAIGCATLRPDGFVSIEAEDPTGRPGIVMTKLLKFKGDRLYVNADDRGGRGLVEVLRAGYSVNLGAKKMTAMDWRQIAAESDPITTDAVRGEVKWKGNADVGRLKGRLVRLRFTLSGKAKLYSFQFAGHTAKRFDHELGLPVE